MGRSSSRSRRQHHCHQGCCFVAGDSHFAAAAAHFEASLKLQPSAEAYRGLAVIRSSAHNYSAAISAYTAALDLALSPTDPDPAGAALLVRNLAAEYAQFCTLTWNFDALVRLVADSRLPPASRAEDRFRMGEAHAAFYTKDYDRLFRLLDCAPERQWPTLGYDLSALMGMYQSAVVDAATDAKGSALTVLERNAAIRAHPVPVCLRAVGH